MSDHKTSGKTTREENTSEQKTSDEVTRTSEFWHEYRRRLSALRERFTGQEAQYLEQVKALLMSKVETVRACLLRETGLDIKTGVQMFPPPDPEALIQRRVRWENVERYGRDLAKIGQTVSLTMEAARQNGKDPVLEGYAMFFWAMENVPVAGTVFLMLDTEGAEKENNILLTAGWADAHISLQGQHAGRLLSALLAEGGDARRQLRQELPGAVLEAANLWRPGQELPLGDRARPRAGKETAGRRQRTLLSRMTRLIEKQGAPDFSVRGRQMHNHQVHAQSWQWQASGTRQAAQGVGGSPNGSEVKFRVLWKGWVI